MSEMRVATVFRIFGGTAAEYDSFVDRATLGLDSRWKREILARLSDPERVADLASGTGIVCFGIARRWPGAGITGVELQHEYLELARKRAAAAGLDHRVKFVCQRAEDAELEPGGFDHVVTSYLPKYADLPRLARKIRAWLAPGGRVVLHDFTFPEDERVRDGWEQTFQRLHREAEATKSIWTPMLRELPGIIRRSDWVKESCRELKRCGFREVTAESLSMGCAAIVTAVS